MPRPKQTDEGLTKFQHYRQQQQRRGIKQLQIWVPDPNRPEFAAEARRQGLVPLYRLTLESTADNGLKAISQVMVDKVLAYPRAKCGPVIGRLSPTDMLALNTMLLVMIGLAD